MPGTQRTLAVLGASADQLFLIRTARELGLRVIAFDRDPRAPGLAEADEGALVSTRDVGALCAWLDRWRASGRSVDGVITMGSDIPDVVAALAAHLGTPSISAEAARLATDKHAMKARFAERGVPIPWFRELSGPDDLRVVVAERGFDLVIKPVDRSGSRGVFLLDARCDLEDLYLRAREFSYSGRVQVEEFLPGLQISTETVLWRGRAVTPGFADRNYELLERFRPRILENGGWVPSVVSAEQRAAVERVVESAATALGIESGIVKGDIVLTPDGPKVIEIAARLSGGDFCESLVPLGSGVNYVRAAIEIALGEEPDFAALAPRTAQAVANRYLFPEPGRLVRIDGEREVRSWPFVAKLELGYRPGDVVPPALSHAHRAGVFVVVGPDRETVQQRIDRVYATLRLVTEPEQPTRA